MYTHNPSFRALLVATLLLFVMSGCTSSKETSPAVIQDVPDGANRILIDRQEPPEALFDDAVQTLENLGYEITARDDEAHTFATAPHVEGNLALRFEGHVVKQPGGARLIAGARWAPSLDASAFRVAEWTQGNDKEAFRTAMSVLEAISYEEFNVAKE